MIISPLRLERPGHWRPLGLAVCFAAAILPAAPLLTRTLMSASGFTLGQAYGQAMLNSLVVAGLVAFIAFAVGLPTGVLAALYGFRGRIFLLSLLALPAVVPTFLWAIGWSAMAIRIGPGTSRFLSGYFGSALVFSATAVPIVTLTALAATRFLTASQVDAVRLAGGESSLLVHACRHAVPPAALAAVLASALTLSDPGPGQILGLRSAASEILTSFSALYDFALAGRQCMTLTGIVLLVALPLVLVTTPRLSNELLAKQVRNAQPLRHPQMGRVTAGFVLVLVMIGLATPLTGLILPLFSGIELSRAMETMGRTGVNTLLYALGAGLLGTVIGLGVAFFAGRRPGLRATCLAVALVILAQPPTLIALGFLQIGSSTPAWADPLLRSRLTVCTALALRLFPVAVLLGLRAWGAMPPSWALAAAVHGVPLTTYLRRVVVPFLAPTAAIAALLVALLATADVSTVLLLHPPGERTLPLTIFTVMANAPESLVATLCLTYILAAAILLAAMWGLATGRTA